MEPINNAVVIYSSVWDAIRLLPEEKQWEAIRAVIDFGFYEQEPENIDPMVRIILIQAMPNIIAAQKRHMAAVLNGEKGKEFGVEGGRPEKVSADEVVHLKRKGMTHAQISEELGISASTVKKKLKEYNGREKLNGLLTASNPLR